MGPLLKDMVATSLKEPCFTYIVRLKNTNEIVATRMMGILERPSSNHFENYESWKPNIIMKLVKELEQKVWDILPNTQKLACGLLISVHQNYTRRGIAQKLVE
uniref:N-acetyltransferase domain-containing protein n=1 Tax=Panagrolaimus sp. PS1159 TaxID=55785 RepID=A0AC35FVJ9_9BILA